MNISIIANKKKDSDGTILNSVIQAFDGRANINVYTDRLTDEVFIDTDVVVVLGGDGTIIRAAKAAAVFSVPVCGVNLGKIGFLASVEVSEIQNMAERILAQDYKIEKRMMFCLHVHTQTGRTQDLLAFNDITVMRGSYPKMIEIEITADEDLLDTYMADGVIISTPTGSTAYSLSAGGPVAEPTMEMFLITPICAYDLHTRSVVLPADKWINISLGGSPNSYATMSVDGQDELTIKPGYKIAISKSSNNVKLISMGNRSFYSVLRKKLGK